MKIALFFSFILFSAVLHQGESTAVRTALEKVLEAVNSIVNPLVNGANGYFIEKLKNETQIQEWSVDIQRKVVVGVADAAFSAFNIMKNSTDVKVLNCIADQETFVLEALGKAVSDNGWCNNRLAANLTRAFQEVTEHLVDRNTQFKKYLGELEACTSGDDPCVTTYINEVVAYVESEFGSEDSLLTALEDVVAVYKIMFGQDVPACNKKYLFPEIADAIHATAKKIFECATS